MKASAKEKRLETMELQLTPKEWAINLADEMRSHRSEADFVRVVADKPYRAWPWVKPFFKLCDQAEARYSDNRQESIHARNWSAQRLRTEFHALKKLIIRSKTETIRLKTGLKMSILHTLILEDAIARAATKTTEWAKRYNTADAETDRDRHLILNELAAYEEFGLRSRASLPSLIEDCFDELTMFVMEFFAHKAAVREIQEKYFDGHPILFRDVENNLAETVELMESAVSTLNEYLATRATFLKSELDREDSADAAASVPLSERERHLVIDIERIRKRAEDCLVDSIADEWVNEATENATADILQETGEHEGYIWQTFRERAK